MRDSILYAYGKFFITQIYVRDSILYTYGQFFITQLYVRDNILYTYSKFFITQLYVRDSILYVRDSILYVRDGILLTCRNHLHHFTEKRFWVNKTCLTPPGFIEVSVLSQESHVYLCVLGGINITSDFTIFLLDLRTVPTVLHFLVFSFYLLINQI